MNEIHALSGAYAVDALDDIERAQFERHLTECSECQAEVTSLREAAALLGEVARTEPSADLRSRILGDIKTVRPLPPLPAQLPAQSPTAADGTDDGTAEGSDDDRADETDTTRQPGTVIAHSRSHTRSASRTERRWLRGLVAAAAVVATIGVGSTVWNPFDGSSNEQVLSAADRVLAAPDAITVSHQLEVGGEATVVVSKSLNKMVVTTKDLPPLPEGTVYEMWLQDAEEGMVPAGLMTAKDAQVVIEGNVANAVGAGITVEPAGGSRVPTSEPVVLFSFENA